MNHEAETPLPSKFLLSTIRRVSIATFFIAVVYSVFASDKYLKSFETHHQNSRFEESGNPSFKEPLVVKRLFGATKSIPFESEHELIPLPESQDDLLDFRIESESPGHDLSDRFKTNNAFVNLSIRIDDSCSVILLHLIFQVFGIQIFH